MKYKILQLKDFRKVEYSFMSYDYAKKHNFKLSDYEIVYKGSTKDVKPIKALEDLFTEFNINRPEDFKGHSLSMSDVVELDGVYYYCDSFGWAKVDDLL